MTKQEIKTKLDQLWSQDFISKLPEWVKERGYLLISNFRQADLLITGINPSFRDGSDTMGSCFLETEKCIDKETWKRANGRYWDNYWGPIRKMLEEGNVNLIDKFDYLDIFHFREQDQKKLSKEILKNNADAGLRFIAEELKITQHIIEDIIKPKLIVVKNAESWAYWGKLPAFVWMGYEYELVKKYDCGELCVIKGLKDSEERIARDEFSNENTCMKGKYVLFAKHINQYTKREMRPTAQLLDNILSGVI